MKICKLRFIILSKSGHDIVTVEKEEVKQEFDKLREKGFVALTKKGEKVESAEKIPDTVEELIFGKPVGYSGERGN